MASSGILLYVPITKSYLSPNVCIIEVEKLYPTIMADTSLNLWMIWVPVCTGDFFLNWAIFIWKGLQSSRTQIIISYGLDELALLKRITWEQGGLPPRDAQFPTLTAHADNCIHKAHNLFCKWLGFLSMFWKWLGFLGFYVPYKYIYKHFKVIELTLSMYNVLGSVPGTFTYITLRKVVSVPTFHRVNWASKSL